MRLDLPGLCIEKRRSGTTRYRVRVAGKTWEKITLPVGPEDPAFLELYHRARKGERAKPLRTSKVTVLKDINWLTSQFEAWMEDRVKAGLLHPGTLHQRRQFFVRLRAVHGKKDMRMPRAKLIEFRDTMLDTPGAADNMVKAVRACYAWAIDRGHVTANPATDIETVNRNVGAIPWSIDELRAYRECHPVGSMAHLSLSLFMFTACRISDVIHLGNQNERVIDGVTYLEWEPRKKGSSRVVVPILPPLERAIRSTQLTGPSYLLTEQGRPFASPAAFGNRFRKWVSEAGLKDRSPHGIRKAAGELMALEGATQYHIMAVHGHTQAKTSEVYTSKVNRQRLATEAMQLLGKMNW